MTDRRHFNIIYLVTLVLLLSGGIIAHRFSAFDETDRVYRVIEDRIVVYLMKGLVSEHHLPLGNDGRLPGTSLIAYVLGGTQESLIYKWRTVGRLYAEGKVRKILVLHRSGITEYSPVLGRNLTNDEWATEKLRDEGVPVEAVEFVPVLRGTFDTFAEAREISSLARSRRVKRLVLVTSKHHTERVRLSFSYFNVNNAFEPYIYGSEERAGIIELLRENITLGIYKYFVLPVDHLAARSRCSEGSDSVADRNL